MEVHKFLTKFIIIAKTPNIYFKIGRKVAQITNGIGMGSLTSLTHSFPMHPSFSGGRERVHWERMG